MKHCGFNRDNCQMLSVNYWIEFYKGGKTLQISTEEASTAKYDGRSKLQGVEEFLLQDSRTQERFGIFGCLEVRKVSKNSKQPWMPGA